MNKRWLSIRRLALAAITLAVLPGTLQASAFPARPIKLIVPYSPGGSSEVAARAVAEGMARSLGQPVIVENRPGAEGAIAVQTAVAAEPDGHTLVLVAASMAALPIAVDPPPFDLAALAPISTLGDVNFGLFVPSSLPVTTTRELLSHAKAQTAPLAYASISLAMDALSTTLAQSGDFDLTRVPYRGGAQAMADLVGGRIQIFFGPVGNGLPATRDGRLRLLATHPHRTPLAPEVPTLAESGVTARSTPMFMLIAAPARTPRPIVERLARSVDETLRAKEVRDRLESLGIAPASSSPEVAAEQLRRAPQAYAAVLRALEASGARTR